MPLEVFLWTRSKVCIVCLGIASTPTFVDETTITSQCHISIWAACESIQPIRQCLAQGSPKLIVRLRESSDGITSILAAQVMDDLASQIHD